jgi:hypothetical protein
MGRPQSLLDFITLTVFGEEYNHEALKTFKSMLIYSMGQRFVYNPVVGRAMRKFSFFLKQ